MTKKGEELGKMGEVVLKQRITHVIYTFDPKGKGKHVGNKREPVKRSRQSRNGNWTLNKL